MSAHEKVNKLLVDFVLGELPEGQAYEVKLHLAECRECRSELKRLEVLLECTSRMSKLSADEQMCISAKNRVFTVVSGEEKSKTIAWPNIGRAFRWRILMKNPITKLAVAAVVIIACLIGVSFWRTSGSGIALADVLARIEKVKAFRYKTSLQYWSTKATGEDPNKRYNFREQRATSLTSQEYGSKSKGIILDPNGGWSTFAEIYFLPQKKTFIVIMPKRKNYWRKELDDVGIEEIQKQSIFSNTDPRTSLKRILKTKYESIGRATIDGIEVEGFRTTDHNTTDPNLWFDIKIWVDVKTRFPVQCDSTTAWFDQMGDSQTMHVVMHDYQWDVPVDAAEFEPPVIPDDYTGTVVKRQFNEEPAIQGLKVWVELLGNYPDPEIITNIDDVASTVLRLAEKSETPAALRLKEEVKGLTDEQISNKLVDFLMPIRGLARFYGLLQDDKKDPAYYGKTVTPKDADKVLMRWKVSDNEYHADNEYRVIYGDLHAETVTPEKLAELEAALPK